MTQCPVCSAPVTENTPTCPVCFAALNSEQPTVRQPTPKESSKTPTTPYSSLSSSRSEGSFPAGTILDKRYRIIGLLGRGGMGEVYKAEDLKLNQTVALKFLPENFARDKASLERFYSEVRTARGVSHPNVCRVFDISEVDGSHFLSMEFIDGDDLSSLLRRIGRLPPDKALEIARQLCAGLHAVHQVGVLHRDLKPANVIIDGRGRARITDFGVAGLESELKAAMGTAAGTPAYMSPEQITGKELTAKSDIYSLGLVLYEVFSGKRAFVGDTIKELVRKHQTSTPTSPSEIVKDIDPLVEQVILRCLEKDPRERPVSALQVAMMLPGGNPLEAAIAAGETPSPEMVAATPKKGALRPPIAVACLAAVVGLFAFFIFVSSRVNLHEWVPLDKSPEVLAERANSIRRSLGYTNPPTDTAYAFNFDSSYLRYAARDTDPNRYEKIRTGQPLQLYFWHRSSPRYFEPWENADVNVSDPPMDISGMTLVILDVRGRLVRFEANPPQSEPQPAENSQTNWSLPFTEAGLDIQNYRDTESKWTPPFFADERKAWEGTHVDHPEVPVRIEAAAFHGKPVYFQIVAPWDRPSRETQFSGSAGMKASGIILTVVFFCALIAALVTARHNLKVGRGDVKGALRLVLFIFSLITLAQLITADHVPTLSGEIALFYQIASLALFYCGLVWVFYVAVEPFIRRRWSELIISWSRLLAGDFRDPMVGRDILVGGVMGLLHTAAIYSMFLLPHWFGHAIPPLDGVDRETLRGLGGIIGHTLFGLAVPIFFAVATPFLLLLFLAVLRRKWLAVGALWLFVFLANGLAFASRGPSVGWIGPFVIATVTVVSIARFGLLAHYAFFFFWNLSFGVALTADFSKWYASGTIFCFVVLISVAVYGFYTSLAGQPLFKGKLLED